MFGIAGYVGLEAGVVDKSVLRRMARQLAPQGRDGEDVLVHRQAGLVQRGANLPHGSGPATPPHLALAYAGEIYNHHELREELAGQGHTFAGDDTAEVVLAAWVEWGAAALDRCNGRFAVAVLDQINGEVTLARDPIGGPPLYYAADGAGRVAFASEIRAVIAAGVVPRRPDGVTIYRYLSSGVHDDTERTFVDRVLRVLPGEMVVISVAGQPHRETYTRLYEELDLLATNRRPDTPAAREHVREVLAAAVQRRAGAASEATTIPEASAGAAELADFVACQQEPVGSLAAYHDYHTTREAGRQAGALLDRSGAADAVAAYLRRRGQPQPSASRRLRRRTAPASLAAPLLAADFAAAHQDLPFHPRSTEDLFRCGLPAVLRYQDRNAAWFSVPRRDPYLDPDLLRTMWSLEPAALRELIHPAPARPAPPAWPARLESVAEDLFGSDSFGARPYVDQSAVLTSYRTTGIDPELCWRLVNLELWLREFMDRDPTIPPSSTFVEHYPKPDRPPGKPAAAKRPVPADDDSLITVEAGA